MAECICDCGGKSIVQVENLKSGHTTSCGCEKVKANTIHGYSRHPAYSILEGMVNRCDNPNSNSYKYYGGRGIKICKQWRNNPGAFIEWAISNGYKKGLSIEREDVNGDYKPSNCKFIPMELQSKNTRKSMRIEHNGIIDTQRGWAKRFGIHPATFRYQMNHGATFFGSSKKEHESPDEQAP